jgi:RNA polymerase sigma-70 factor (ECF subfamily)
MDATTFKEIILSRYGDMYRMAYAIVQDSDDAKDVVQDAVARMWVHRRELTGVESPGAFCTTTVKRVAIDLLRARSRRPDAVEQIDDESAPRTDAHAGIEDADILRQVERMLDALPPNQREVIRLRSHADCSIDEIASITGLTQANVRQLLSRARRSLKQLADKLL